MTSELKGSLSRRSRAAWRLAAFLVTVAALVWVFVLLARAWPTLASRSDELRLGLLLLGVLASVLSNLLVFEAFVAVAGIFFIEGLTRRSLAHLHFTSQLLKHLPGRVWGIGYQSIAGKHAGSVGDWLLANMSHMVLAIFFAVSSAWVVLGFAEGVTCGVLASVVGLLSYWGGWALVAHRLPMQWIGRLRGRMPGHIGQALLGIGRASRFLRSRIFLLFVASSLLWYVAWLFYGAAYPELGARGGAQLCAYYMLAWFVGYVSLLTPSGLGVRELMFAWLAKDFSGDSVAMMAIIGRVSMLFVDVLLGLVFAPFSPRHR